MKTLKGLYFLVLFLSISAISFSQKVYEWRGENRKGIYDEQNLQQKWAANGPTELWATETIGSGYAAPVITADKVLINGEIEGTSYLFAFDFKGNLLWKTPNGNEHLGKDFAANFPGARSTPTVVGDLVYTMSGIGRIACFELVSGKEKWAVDLVKEYGGIENMFGYSESPITDAKNIYCYAGGGEGNMVALDRFTGKKVWVSKATGDTTSFCSPILVNLGKRQLLISLSRHSIFGLDVLNGELLWKYPVPGFKYDGEHCNTPIYENGFIYFSAAEDKGNGVVKLQLASDGKSVTEVWTQKAGSGGFGGIVKKDNNIFVTNKMKKLLCINAETGSISDSLRNVKGGLILAGNNLICYNETGEVKQISYQNNKFAELSKFKISKGAKEHFSHPVIANGVLYIRHGKALMAYDIAETKK